MNNDYTTKVTNCTCGGSLKEKTKYKFKHNNIQFLFQQCNNCKRLVLNPTLKEEHTSMAFQQEYYGAGETKFIGPGEKIISWFRNRRAVKAKKLIPNNSKILDFGCGNGNFLSFFINHGCECYGNEFSELSAARAKKQKGLHIKTGEISSEDYPKSFFNMISLWHVAEHLKDPDTTINYLYQWMAPGGVLLFAVPNIGSWQARIFKGKWFGMEPPRTFFQYNISAINYLFKDKFKIEETNYLSWEQNLYWILQSVLNVMGFERDDFYSLIKGNRKVHYRDILQVTIIGVIIIPSIIMTYLEALSGNGGSVEIVAEKI
ncbi:MAG: class I SAM-dependent methyltransferase [Nanoarchaeota archaeon]